MKKLGAAQIYCLLGEFEGRENYNGTYFDEDGCISVVRNNLLHNEVGPAEVRPDGTKTWCVDGLYHRLGGPAVEHADGTKEWYEDGLLHNLNGPAIERPDGTKEWYNGGERHRLDGPAIEHADGRLSFYVRGSYINTIDPKDPAHIDYVQSLHRKNAEFHERLEAQADQVRKRAHNTAAMRPS